LFQLFYETDSFQRLIEIRWSEQTPNMEVRLEIRLSQLSDAVRTRRHGKLETSRTSLDNDEDKTVKLNLGILFFTW